MKNWWLAILLLICLPALSQVKRVGTPSIINYPKSEYRAGTQNWDIAQDPDGFMYFANNNGVLRFDGLTWELFPISSTSPVRSVCIDDSGTIYLGLDDDFGIFDVDKAGYPQFRSLRKLLAEDIEETDVIWKIYDTQYGIVFQSYQYIFIYKDDKVQVIRPQKAFSYSFYANNRLFFHEPGVGLFELINGYVYKVPWADELANVEVLSIVSFYENQLLIGTSQDGWFEYKRGKLEKWNTPASKQVENDVLYSAVQLEGNNLAMGTILNGVIIANPDGVILQHLNREQGMQNNTVLSLYNDQMGNLWLGLDNGIDFVELNSPLSYISAADGISTGYCSIVFNGYLYLGTNQGLFAKPFQPNHPANNNQQFQLISGTEGQVWSLQEVDNQLICGHNFGVFLVEGRTAQKISNEPGGWVFKPSLIDSSYLIGGSYKGLSVYQLNANRWEFKHKVKGFSESSRFFIQDKNGNIWVSHGAKGLFCVRLNEACDSVISVKNYGVDEGLPDIRMNQVLSVHDQWFVSTVDGIYSYDPASDRFEEDEALNALFDLDSRLKFVTEDAQQNIWYIAANGVGVLRRNDDRTYSKVTSPFRQLTNRLVREWEFLYVYDNDNVFIGTEFGFAHYSSRVVTTFDVPLKSFIPRVEVPYLDTVIYTNGSGQKHEFPFQKNAFRFYFAAPSYQDPEQLQFSYFIDNYSEEWSEWSSDNYRDLTNLRENEYVFRLKARNSFGMESQEATFSFVVAPPWFRSKLAFYLYVLFLLLLGIGMVWIVQLRFYKSKQNERRQHQEELRQKEQEYQQQSVLAEKEIIRLKNEKLKAEKLFLDKELANQTLSIVNKNKFLLKINRELKRLGDETTDSTVKTKVVLLKKRIDKEIDIHQQDKIFESYFEEVHAEFFARLNQRFPQLSPKDLRLCAYIRMNMSTKEIATLQNISHRGVEISRYRLRKKLGLSRDVNLSSFLLSI